jgi:hypothetical protein
MVSPGQEEIIGGAVAQAALCSVTIHELATTHRTGRPKPHFSSNTFIRYSAMNFISLHSTSRI